MKRKINWGILGPGNICHKFVESLKLLEDANLLAVGSRSKTRAEEFASKYNIPVAYGSYEELVNDKDIDIIYVATPHSGHYENAKLCIEAGKAVLCEKSFTVNANEAEELIKLARNKKVFLMEAMWTRYLPAISKLRELLAEGAIGDVQMVKADFGFRFEGDNSHRLLNPELAGGALLDVGIYTISFASMIFGSNPIKITGIPSIGETGVDEQFASILEFEGGKLAVCCAAVKTHIQHDAWVFGTKGRIHIPDFWHAKLLNVYKDDGSVEKLELPFVSTGYFHEAEEAVKCLQDGKLESSIMTLDETYEIMKIMDKLRNQWGLRYPFEKTN